MRSIIGLLLGLLLIVGASADEDLTVAGTVFGLTVGDDGLLSERPVPDVWVELFQEDDEDAKPSRREKTNANGRFEFELKPPRPDQVRIKIRHAGYQPLRKRVKVPSDSRILLTRRAALGLPNYRSVAGVSGNIKSVGSDTMNNLMTLWAQSFKGFYKGAVGVEIEGKGSTTAPPALLEGRATFGPMSRRMKSKEVDHFTRKYGYPPTQLRTAFDMIAVFVHKDNPIAKSGLTLSQIDAIFSSTRKGGHERDIRTWGDLGLTGEWKNRAITLYGRNSASGTYGYFKKAALAGGEFKSTMREQPGSSAVVSSVGSDLRAIGYSGAGFRTAAVALVPIGRDAARRVLPSPRTAYTGAYPLARSLWLAVNHKPGSQLDPLRREFIRLIYSEQGQSIVTNDGYVPLPARLAVPELAKVGLELR